MRPMATPANATIQTDGLVASAKPSDAASAAIESPCAMPVMAGLLVEDDCPV